MQQMGAEAQEQAAGVRQREVAAQPVWGLQEPQLEAKAVEEQPAWQERVVEAQQAAERVPVSARRRGRRKIHRNESRLPQVFCKKDITRAQAPQQLWVERAQEPEAVEEARLPEAQGAPAAEAQEPPVPASAAGVAQA